jgi:hypothetical protein
MCSIKAIFERVFGREMIKKNQQSTDQVVVKTKVSLQIGDKAQVIVKTKESLQIGNEAQVFKLKLKSSRR